MPCTDVCVHPTCAAGCCVAVCGFFCILSISSVLPEGLGHLEAVQYLVSWNPSEAHCYVQLILLFYRIKSFLRRWPTTAVENHPPPLALQSLVLFNMPHHQPCNVQQLLQMLESLLLAPTSSDDASTADCLVHVCTNQKGSQWSFPWHVSFAVIADGIKVCRYCCKSNGMIS